MTPSASSLPPSLCTGLGQRPVLDSILGGLVTEEPNHQADLIENRSHLSPNSTAENLADCVTGKKSLFSGSFFQLS